MFLLRSRPQAENIELARLQVAEQLVQQLDRVTDLGQRSGAQAMALVLLVFGRPISEEALDGVADL
jgi:hypothetical protein